MALGNTPRRETTISVEASKSYAFGIRFKDTDDVPIDLTDCVVRLVSTEPPYLDGLEVLNMVAVSTDPISGFTQFNFQAEDLSLTPGSYAYDVTLLPPSGYSSPILKGYIEVGSNADVDTSNIYTGIDIGSEVSITLENGNVVEVTIERVDGLYVIVSGLISEFTEAMEEQVALAAESAEDAADSASLSQTYAASMQVWLDNAGFPFWKGTHAEYLALTPKDEVLYLIVDEVISR